MALDTMQTIFARVGGNWHYTSPSGVKPDLHHALLAKNLGGGLAYVGVICDSNLGFGLTANMNGNFVSMDNAVVWDSSTVSLTHNEKTLVCVINNSHDSSLHLSSTCSSCTRLGTTLAQATPTMIIPP